MNTIRVSKQLGPRMDQPGRLTTDECLTADPGVPSGNQPGPILSWRYIMKLFPLSFSWESNNNVRKHHIQESQEVGPSPNFEVSP